MIVRAKARGRAGRAGRGRRRGQVRRLGQGGQSHREVHQRPDQGDGQAQGPTKTAAQTDRSDEERVGDEQEQPQAAVPAEAARVVRLHCKDRKAFFDCYVDPRPQRRATSASSRRGKKGSSGAQRRRCAACPASADLLPLLFLFYYFYFACTASSAVVVRGVLRRTQAVLSGKAPPGALSATSHLGLGSATPPHCPAPPRPRRCHRRCALPSAAATRRS